MTFDIAEVHRHRERQVPRSVNIEAKRGRSYLVPRDPRTPELMASLADLEPEQRLAVLQAMPSRFQS